MRVFTNTVLCLALLTASINHLNAREYVGPKSKDSKSQVKAKAVDCSPAQSLQEFFVNNVRTAAETGGNTWYDRGNGLPYYEVPAGGGNHAIFAGALWMGGEDPAGNLKLAAVRFRQNGNDYWPGPLTTDGAASIQPETCTLWDRFFNMSRQMVETHRYYFTLLAQGIDPTTDPLFENGYDIPTEILEWPAEGDVSLGQSFNIAPFADLRDPESGEILTTPDIYEPTLGDYPLYDLDQEIDCRTRLVTDPVPLFGDFSMYWVFNDKGNVHTESQGEPIGMEIQAQMFGFTTNDEINNMTFCNYVLINRGSLTLEDTYFAQWIDTDLGNFSDDFVGCDVGRGLGYTYNGDDNDEGSTSGPGYGSQPPALGIDFFEGPYQDPDGINNAYGIGEGEALNGLGYFNLADSLEPGGVDSIIDNERFGMRRFLYHNNADGPAPTLDPQVAVEYYNFMRGIWRNGVEMTFGGTGYNPTDQSALDADFMFPGDSDPLNWGTGGIDPNYGIAGGWTEENEGNPPADRRFMQSAGPFTLDPGEFNNITVGAVYARAQTGGPFASVGALFQADDKAQALFENCFRLLDGPDAPDLTAQELDKEAILYIRNTSPLSNNQGEQYVELDPTIPPTDLDGTPNDRFYRFQGYQIYQLRDAEVSVGDIQDPERSRLVFQCDIRDFEENGDPIAQIVNYEFDESIGLPVPTEKVNGANRGITHSFQVTEDQFASGDTRLINFKKYYFVAIAYGYNEYEPYNPDPNVLTGQAFPYLRGRSSATGEITPITVIPHKPSPEQFGTVSQTNYGDGVPITRVEGAGNGGNDLLMDDESVNAVMESSPYKVDRVSYLPGRGPINVKVIDPLNVVSADFELKFTNDLADDGGYEGDFNDARWFMIYVDNPEDTIFSENTIEVANEQIVPEYGISVEIGQYENEIVNNNANLLAFYPQPLSSGIEFTGEEWLEGVPDQEGNNFFNWIRSGIIQEDEPDAEEADGPCYQQADGSIHPFVFNDYPNVDDDQLFEDIVGGTFAPARLVAAYDCGPAPLSNAARAQLINGSRDLSPLNSVDLFITQDKSKWSRVPVYEMQSNPLFAQLRAEKMDLRGALSVDKNGRHQLEPGANVAEATFNGNQVIIQEDIDDMSASEIDDMLELLALEYPDYFDDTSTEGDLLGLSFGMSWFPGYAITPETGERQNMAFGENSQLAGDNGKDMLWNPSPRVTTNLGDQVLFGGEHYVYTFRNERRITDNDRDVPMYDGGQFIYERLNRGNSVEVRRTYRALDWIGIPVFSQLAREAGLQYLSPEDGLVPGEAKIFAHVARSYEPYATTKEELGDASFPFTPVDENYDLSENFWYPSYEFSTVGIETFTNVQEEGENALDLIDIVPNPYYAYSSYEQSRVDNRVKFVNLPPECKIQIFTINGTLVRILEKDNPNTFLEWDLQNEAFIPIAGGVYLIHVQSPRLGERVLKFFMATRPTDLRNF
ncbi:MAG: T9SS C-terminal target domain-containing protein [Cryomorphaceae bacterium]|nr:T9SS C-terminal target domain-containing protein [Flavobacteriales bacterium]